MRLQHIFALSLVLALATSCQLVDDIKAAINDITQVSQGNLKSLVNSSSETMQEAGQQLEQLKTNAPQLEADDSDSGSGGFRLGGAPAMTLIPTQDGGEASSATCPAITRANDPEAGTREVSSDFSGCSDADGRSGTIVATLSQSGGSLELIVNFEDFVRDGTVKNGELKWTVTFTGLEKVLVTTNEQLELVTQPEGFTVPLTVTTQQTINYTIEPSKQMLGIDGSGSFTQGENTATLSFASVKFDFSEAGCDRGPVEGNVQMSSAGNSYGVAIADCKATATGPEGTSTLTDQELQDLFGDTLSALQDFFKRLNSVATKEFASNQCKADGGTDGAEPNNSDADAFQISTPSGTLANGIGTTLEGLTFADDDWYQVNLPSDGTWAILAVPRSADAIWPLVCIENLNGDLISHAIGLPGSKDCFPGGADVTVNSATTVRIQVTDEFGEYACQNYSLVVFDPESQYELPLFGVDEDYCSREWIEDEHCDDFCYSIWDELDLTYETDVAVCEELGEEDYSYCPAGQGTCEVPDSTEEDECVDITGGLASAESVGCDGTCPQGSELDLDEYGFWCPEL